MTSECVSIEVSQLGRPPTWNGMFNMVPYLKRQTIRTWRGTTKLLWLKELRGRRFTGPVRVVATPLHKDRRSPQDVGACVPAVKAAVDGLRDARGLVDDSPEYVFTIVFQRPEVCGTNGLRMEVYGPLVEVGKGRGAPAAVTGPARRP